MTAASAVKAQQTSQRAKWVSDAVRNQRWEAGACLRCGNQGHAQHGCSLRPAKPPAGVEETRKSQKKKTSTASTVAKKKRVVEEVLTDDSDTEESGKE